MPHADSALVPSEIQSKADFWQYVHDQLAALLDGQRNWSKDTTTRAGHESLERSVSHYASLLSFPVHFGPDERAVNWAGFYLVPTLFPPPTISPATSAPASDKLLLGPFCGKPACQYVITAPRERARGVCAAAFLEARTQLVPDVEKFPGHIACDGGTRSEVVVPLILKVDGEDGEKRDVVLGVLDLDCLADGGFDEEDRKGLERIAALVVRACDW